MEKTAKEKTDFSAYIQSKSVKGRKPYSLFETYRLYVDAMRMIGIIRRAKKENLIST